MIDATDPLDPSGASLDMTQVCWTRDGEDFDFAGNEEIDTLDAYSGGEAARLANDPGTLEYDFTVNHQIAGSDFGVALRECGDGGDTTTSGDAPPSAIELDHANGNTYTLATGTSGRGVLLTWQFALEGDAGWNVGSDPPDLTPGDYTLRLDITDTVGPGEAWNVDVVAPYDSSKDSSLTFDDDNGGGGAYLDGPEFFPETVVLNMATTETRRDVTEATVTLDTNNTDANQYIELRIGSDAFDRTNNSATASTTASTAARSIDVNVALSRYPEGTNPQNATPRFGYNGQSITSYELSSDPSAVNADSVGVAEIDAIVPQGLITGDRLEESGELTASGDLLTHAIFAPFDVFSTMSVRSSEKVEFSNDE